MNKKLWLPTGAKPELVYEGELDNLKGLSLRRKKEFRNIKVHMKASIYLT